MKARAQGLQDKQTGSGALFEDIYPLKGVDVNYKNHLRTNGHPLGTTDVYLALTCLKTLQRDNKQLGIAMVVETC